MDRDDFDDPAMTDLLRSWGRTVRTAPPQLEALHQALARVDAEPATRPSWKVLLAAAAVLLLIGLLLYSENGVNRPTGPLGGAAPVLRDLALAKGRELVRGATTPEFVSGDDLFVHYFTDQGGFATVLLLRPPESATLVLSAPLSTDDEPLGPIRLAAQPGGAGLAAVLVLSSAERLSDQDVDGFARAARTAMAGVRTGEELRRAVTAGVQDRPGVGPTCIPFLIGR